MARFLFSLIIIFSFSGCMSFINDISTNLETPPSFSFLSKKLKKDFSYPIEFKSIQLEKYPTLKSLELSSSVEVTFKKVQQIIEGKKNWTVELLDSDTKKIELIARTKVFRFKDIVAIQVVETAQGSRIDMRSKSLLGKSDLGVNAKRIIDFFAEFS